MRARDGPGQGAPGLPASRVGVASHARTRLGNEACPRAGSLVPNRQWHLVGAIVVPLAMSGTGSARRRQLRRRSGEDQLTRAVRPALAMCSTEGCNTPGTTIDLEAAMTNPLPGEERGALLSLDKRAQAAILGALF